MADPVDPSPFEPFMPPAVRALVEAARRGEGPAAQWLTSFLPGWGRVGDCFGLLRGRPPLPDESRGWLVGIGTFGDEHNAIADVMVREGGASVAPFVLAAIGAGIRTGVPAPKRQWAAIERIVGLAGLVPDALRDVLPLGLVSDQALARGVALKLAQRVGDAAIGPIEAARREARTKKAKQRLDDALAALRAPDAGGRPTTDDALLARLVEAYGQTQDPRLVLPIETLGARAFRARGPLEARSKGELEGAWLALAAKGDPADIDRLLRAPWPGTWKVALTRIEALPKRPDPRVEKTLRALGGRYPSQASHPLHAAAERLLARASTPTRAPDEVVHAAEAATASASALATLHRAVCEDRNDRARLAVLADALQTEGDPRGEFLALALAVEEGRATAATNVRLAALLEEHADTWSEGLPGVYRESRRFRLGYLAAARIKASAERLTGCLDALEWWTLEELSLEAFAFTDAFVGPLARVLARAPNLRTLILEGFTGSDFVENVAAEGAFPSLRAIGTLDWRPTRIPPGLPGLKLLAFGRGAPHVEILERAAAVGVCVVVCFGGALPGELLRAFDATTLPELRFVGDKARSLDGNFAGWATRVRRGEGVAMMHGEGPYVPGSATPLLEALAVRGARAVTLRLPTHGTAEARADVERVAAALQLSVRFDAAPFALFTP